MNSKDVWHLADDVRLQRGQNDPFAAAIRSTRMSMLITDPHQHDNPIIFANDAFLTMTGYQRREIKGRNCRFLQGPDTDPATVAQIRAAIATKTDIAVDILNYKKDGTPFWNSLYLCPVLDSHGISQYFFASQFDSTEKKRNEILQIKLQNEIIQLNELRTKELEEALTRSTLLLHEVDHRVKNNLQMISSMLTLQVLSIPDERIKNTLQEMLERVNAMGLVHKRLYQSDDLTEFDIGEFTREIASNLVAASGRRNIGLTVEAKSVKIKAGEAASVALVVNETITNALKHAFPGGRSGDIMVSVKPTRGACEISIRDDGAGMPGDAMQRSNFGGMLIETLIAQLRATIEWHPAHPGTQVRIMLPLH